LWAEQCARNPKDNPNMIIEEKVFELPSEDQHKLQIVEIGELRTFETAYGEKEKFAIKILVLDQKSEKDGSPLHVFLNVSPSIGHKATLCKFCRRLKLNLDKQFDTEDLIGINFVASIAHNEGTGNNAGKTFANLVIDTVRPLTVGLGKAVETV
jgi:hypothetical protein